MRKEKKKKCTTGMIVITVEKISSISGRYFLLRRRNDRS